MHCIELYVIICHCIALLCIIKVIRPALGDNDGNLLGFIVGCTVGLTDGTTDGTEEGHADGKVEGRTDGTADGHTDERSMSIQMIIHIHAISIVVIIWPNTFQRPIYSKETS